MIIISLFCFSLFCQKVGGESGRWEYWVAGDGVTRACDGVDLSKPGEIVVCKNSYLHLEKSLKRASRMLGETLQTGKKKFLFIKLLFFLLDIYFLLFTESLLTFDTFIFSFLNIVYFFWV